VVPYMLECLLRCVCGVWFFIPSWKVLASVGLKQFHIITFVEVFVGLPERYDLVKHLKSCYLFHYYL